MWPGEAGRPSAAEAGNAQQADAEAGGAQPRRGPGRPPGIPAWNKGVPHSEAHRKRISHKLKQKWKDPEFRSSVSEGLAGKPAWNAGQPHDADTRRKMREAKLGRRPPAATRKAMSAAATGRVMGEEARAAVGDRFRGAPKSLEHRSKLAAMARRRHAAARVLRAVEAVYSAASAAPPGQAPAPRAAPGASGGAAGSGGGMAPGGGPPPGSAGGLSPGAPPAPPSLGAVRAAAYSMGLTGLSDGSGRRLSRAQILNTFKAELREYRALQEELSTWTAAFRERNQRKPNLVDVQRTGIPWLIDRFKQYVVLRDRLFSDTSVLRGKLQEAIPDPESLHGGAAPAPGALPGGPINANGPAGGARSAAASRFASVMEYRLQQQARSAAAAAPAPAAPPAAEPQPQAAAAAAGEQRPLAAAQAAGAQAPPRVRMAMAAALEYRQKRAQATKAAADAAAAAARAATSAKAAAGGAKGRAAGGAAGEAVQPSAAQAVEAQAQPDAAPAAEPGFPAAEAGAGVPPAIPGQPCLPWQAA